MIRILVAGLALGSAALAPGQVDGRAVAGKDRVQAYLGVMEIEDQVGQLQNRDGEPVDIEFANLLAIGIEAESPLRGRDSGLELGVNAGGGLGWKGSDTRFAGRVDQGGGTIAFRVDNEMMILEGHIGGYLRAHLGKSADFYLGGGPAIIFAEHDVDDGEIDRDTNPSAGQTSDGTVILGGDGDSDIVIGFYARAGLEFDLGGGKQWGVGIRYLGGELNFNDTVGQFDLEGAQVLLTYSAWF